MTSECINYVRTDESEIHHVGAFNKRYLIRFLKFFFFDKIVVCEIISVQNEK